MIERKSSRNDMKWLFFSREQIRGRAANGTATSIAQPPAEQASGGEQSGAAERRSEEKGAAEQRK